MNTKKDQDITEICALISSIEQDVAMGWIPNQWLLSPLKAALTALESPPIGYIDPQSLNNFQNGKSNKEWLKLPEEKVEIGVNGRFYHNEGWNACLAKVKQLNGVDQ